MNWDKDIQNSLDAHLSGLHVSEQQQAQMFNRIVRGEQPIMKKKISAALVFAIVMVIAMGSMALAAGLGLFGHFRQTQENNNGARLEKLETLADTYETTKAVAMPTPAVPVTGDTMYDKLLSEQYSHTFELTLDQAYCDGHKLYYSYTLKRSAFDAKLDRVIVTEVRENSPAKRAGLLPGDVIELLNGSVVAGASARKLDKEMGAVQAGDTVKMTVLRSGKKVAISMVAGET